MKKEIKLRYGVNEVVRAFRDVETMKEKGYEATGRFVRGRKSADLEVEIEYKKKFNKEKGKK